ncbi:MAG TPA: M36 family metallopeptidase, partial [Kofleriaceae bacterium]
IDHGRLGPVVVKLHAELGGVEIFGEELSVVMNRKLEGVALSGYLTSTTTPPARAGGLGFGLAPAGGAAAALGQLAGRTIDPALLVPAGSHDGYDYFTVAASAGVLLEDPIRVKRVYFHLADGLEAAYYAEVIARTGPAPIDLLAADGSALATTQARGLVISAATAQPLFAKDLLSEVATTTHERNALDPSGFLYRVWADPVTGIPLDTPAGNAVHPKVVATPDGSQAAFVGTSDVLLPNYPFSRNDPWLAPGATETNGNNADTYLNLFTPDGLGNPIATPADPPTGDFRAQITAAGQFLHAQIPDGNGALAEGRQGAIQQLFYDLNFLHDWYYDAGFDETAGNAQADNYARGGAAGDSIKGQVQDFAGFSNANMLTPADGSRPRMRMYVFPSPANHLELQAPAAVAAKYAIGISMTGTQTVDVTTDIVRATFSAAPTCTVTNAAGLAGKIAMFDFDNTDGTGCSFSTRITRLSGTTTASAVLMVYTSAAATAVANITGFNATHTKPVAVVSWNTGQLIKGQLAVPTTVTARLYRAPDRDGALDNQIVFHEWFHYVSNRLNGNAAGLNTNMSGGMGEGWSDFNSMMLTVRADDTQTPSNTSFEGAYALATYATSGVPFSGAANQGYYFGIRRYPYSTDLAKNPLTFRHIANGVALPVGPPVGFGANGSNNAEVHNTGEVWASMLWECYAGILRDTLGPNPRLTFQAAQDRMKRYLIAGLKITPISPTITEARDGVLAAAYATDPSDYLACRLGFAKRGAGPHAVSPDRYSATNVGVVEDFSIGPDLEVSSVAFSDNSSLSCDTDGVVDHGEYGVLTVSARNIGGVSLSGLTATITTASSDVWYPIGNTVTFPPAAPGATVTAGLLVAYVRTVSGIQQLDFQVDASATELTQPITRLVGFRTNTDEIAASNATDTVEPAALGWTRSFNATLGNLAPWARVEIDPLHHGWHVDDPNIGSDQYLISPVMTVDGSGSLNVQFDHSWSFEFDGGGNYDGGVIEMSVNGGAFTDIGGAVGGGAYNGTILNYSGDVNPLKGRPGFVQASAGVIHTSVTRAVAPGSTVQVRFRFGADSSGAASGWNLDNIAFSGVVETPFATMVADGDTCTVVPVSADLAIDVTDNSATATAGSSITYAITATNAGGDDIIGAKVVDTFPAELTCTWTCAASSGGGCARASGSGNISEFALLPVGGAVTYTAVCTLLISTTSPQLSNTATVANPGPVTDPVPGNNSATDTDTVVHVPAHLTGGKTVSGNFNEGGTVTYTIALFNDGVGPQSDNAGNELTDVLPAGLTLVSATATSGTAVATIATNTVSWNGSIAAGGSVTITIVATITATQGTTISNQATFNYDSQGIGTNDVSGTTDAFVCALGPP